MLSRDQILGFKDKAIGELDEPELGGKVGLARFSAEESDRLFKKLDDSCPHNVAVIVVGICDKDGNRLFTDDDKAALGKLPATVATRIANAILEHNGLGAQAPEEAKNASGGTASDGSGSA